MDARTRRIARVRLAAVGLSLATVGIASIAVAGPGAPASAPRAGSRGEARVELGRRLFFDPRVSRAGMRSCADCHDPDHGYSDRDVKSFDDRGTTRRHSQTLVDAHASPAQHWDGAFRRIEDLVTARTTLTSRGRYGFGHEPTGAGRASLSNGVGDGVAPGGAAGGTVVPPSPQQPPPEPDPYDGADEGGGGDGETECKDPPPGAESGARAPSGDESPPPASSDSTSPPSSPTTPPATTSPATTQGAPPSATPPSGDGNAGAGVPKPAGAAKPPLAKPPEDPYAMPSASAAEKESFLDATVETADLPFADRSIEAAGRYREAFTAAFGSPNVTIQRIADAIDAYCASITSGTSPYDRFAAGDESAITRAARRGLELFRGRAGCAQCHDMSGPRSAFTDYEFHNSGISWRASAPGYGSRRGPDAGDAGARDAGRARKQQRAFKTPTLRDVARRGPYMHDGSIDSLEAVVRHYGSVRAASPHGSPHGTTSDDRDPALDPRLRPLELAPADVSDLIAFLHALTSDERPGLAASAWRERADTTTLRLVDDAGKPLAGWTLRLVPAGDRLPGSMPAASRGRRVTTDDAGVVSFQPERWTHTRVLLGDGVAPVAGSLVPDTCREATIRVPVRGRVALFLTLPSGVAAPESVSAVHETALFFPDRRIPRTVFRRRAEIDVGGKVVAQYDAPFRTDVPDRAALVLPVKTWGMSRLRVTLEPGEDVRLDLAK